MGSFTRVAALASPLKSRYIFQKVVDTRLGGKMLKSQRTYISLVTGWLWCCPIYFNRLLLAAVLPAI